MLDNLLSQDSMTRNTNFVGLTLMIILMLVGAGLLAHGIGQLDATRAIVLFIGTFLILAYVDFRVLFESNQN